MRYSAAAGNLADLVAPPYDVISPAQRERLAARHPAGAIHLILPQGAEPYREAARLLDDWKTRGWLQHDRRAAFFLVAQSFKIAGRRSERFGLLAGLELQPFAAGIVLPHEQTLSGPKEDRLRLIRACATNLSPIFTLVDTPLGLPEIPGHPEAEALADFRDDADVRIRLWRIGPGELARDLARRVAEQQVFIADGHHRYEISLAYRDERRAADPALNGTAQPFDFVLTYLASTRDTGLAVLPTHRILSDAVAHEAPLKRWKEICRVEEMDDATALCAALEAPAEAHPGPRLGLLRRGARPALLSPGPAAAEVLATLAPELARLDVTFLHQILLPGVPPEGFRYTHDATETITESEKGATAFLLPSPQINDVLDISRAHLTMPQKSTYFYPKVPTGLVFNPL